LEPQSEPQPQDYCVSFEDVQDAADRTFGTVHKTPVMTCRSLIASSEHDDGKNYFFKVEAMQKTGSFKFRGALNAVRYHLEHAIISENESESENKNETGLSVVTHSSGNHAQALALAAEMAAVRATIVMPNTAPLVKKNAVRDFGATIVTVENSNEARKSEAERIVAETGAVFVHPSEDPLVIAGQGTVALEFIGQVREMADGRDLDAVIIPVGGGGLAAGNCIALRALLDPSVKIVLAEPETLNDAQRSFREGRLLHHPPGTVLDSVADGLKTTLGPNTWPIVRDLVDDVITVSETEILRATKMVWERLKVAIEPSAGVGVAVASSREFHAKYPREESGVRNVGIVLCGGNVDIGKIALQMNELGL